MDDGAASQDTGGADDAGAAVPQALFNPFGTLGVVAQAWTPAKAEPAVDTAPSLLALAALVAGIALLLRKALQ